MKKIVLIEDSAERQSTYIKGLNLDGYSDILDNMTGVRYEKIYRELKSTVFALNYEVVIVHQSGFTVDDNRMMLGAIEKYCASGNQKLIFFSGNISSSRYFDDPEILYINDKIFYENLKEFLDESKIQINLQILRYGRKWKINLLNKSLQKVKKVIATNQQLVSLALFKSEVDFDSIKDLVLIQGLENDYINMNQLKSIQTNIEEEIYKSMEF